LVSDQPATARVGHDQIVRDVNLFTAKRFLDEQDDLLHQTVNFLFSPGIGGTGKNALQERSPFKEYYYALREGLIILIKRFEDFEQQARTLLETNYPEQVSLLIEDTFYPLVDDMETFFERLYATNVRMYLTWRDSGGEADHMSRYIPLQIVPSEEDERLMLYVPEDPWAGVDEEDPRGEASAIKRQYQRIASRFRGLVCNLNRKAAVVDLNGAVLDYLDNAKMSTEVTFSEQTPCTRMNPDRLQFVLQRVGHLLADLYQEVVSEVRNELFSNNRLFVVPLDGYDASWEGRAMQAVFFLENKLGLSLRGDGVITFSYQIDDVLIDRWVNRAAKLQAELTACSAILDEVGGNLETKVDPNQSAAVVHIRLPYQVGSDSLSFDRCLQKSQERQTWNSQHYEPATLHLKVPRTVLLEDGQRRQYEIELSGAAFLSDQARDRTRSTLDKVDRFIREIPGLNYLRLWATGMATHIQRAFDSGTLSISVSGGDTREGEASWRSYHYIYERRFGETRDTVHAKPSRWFRENYNGNSVSFSAATFHNESIIELVLELAKRTQLLQLPVDHDQQRDLVTETEFTSLIKNYLRDLIRILDEVKERGNEQQLKSMVMPIIALSVADVGVSDELFSLRIYSGSNDLVVSGHFSRKNQRFAYKHVNAPDVKTLTDRVIPLMEKLVADKQISFRLFDQELQVASVDLPERLIMQLMESMHGISHHEHYLSSPASDVLKQYLNKPTVSIRIENEKISVTDEVDDEVGVEDAEPQQLDSYGVITGLFGDNPEEVKYFANAKKLYEEGYQFFKPSDFFLEEYERLQRDAGQELC